MYSSYVIRLLKEEIEQANQEVISLKDSLRYKAGCALLEIFPLSLRSLGGVKKLFGLFYERFTTRNKKSVLNLNVDSSELCELSIVAGCLLYSAKKPEAPCSDETIWKTNDPNVFAAVMDRHLNPELIILEQLDQAILRRLARWQVQGGRIEWQPIAEQEYDLEMLSYVQGLLKNPLES